MTYAEQFQAPSSLETPAKWLQWAKSALVAKELDKCAYNLRQFWASIKGLGGVDVLRLNAESQACLASLYMAQQYQKTFDLAKYSGNSQFVASMSLMVNPALSGVGASTALSNNKAWTQRFEGVVNWFRDKIDAGAGETLKAQVDELGAKAKEAAERAQSMAQEAQAARGTARGARLVKVTTQGARTTTQASQQNQRTAIDANRKETPDEAARKAWEDFWNYEIFGIKWWILAGCVVASAALVLPESPRFSVTAGAGGRRR